MKLIIPPLCEPTVPLLGPYQLSGFAKKIKFKLNILDWNVKFVKHMVNVAGKLSSLEVENYESVACSHFLRRQGIGNYSELLRRLRHCQSIHEYWSIIDYLRACYDLYSLRFTNLRFRFDGLDSTYQWYTWNDVTDFMRNYGVDSELYQLFREWVRQLFKEDSAENIIGISLTFESQLFFALLLCKAISEYSPNACIIVGGGFVNSFIDSPDKMGPLADYCDFVIVGEGEALIWRLAQRESDNKNALRAFCSPSGRRAFFGRASSLCQQQLSVSAPYFEEGALVDYFSPSRIIPLRFTSQCYWSRCQFCAEKESHTCISSNYDFEEVTRFCIEGKNNSCFDGVYFLDSAIPVPLLRTFAESIVKSGVTINWGSNIRCEHSFADEKFIALLASSGCKFLKFGLESASQKVLEKMCKGTKVEDAASFIRFCRKYGILVHSYVMFAFPGEDDADRKKTMHFLLSEETHPDNYNCSEFVLYEKAPLASRYREIFECDRKNSSKWNIPSQQFTNEAVKKDIVETRQQFDKKFPSMHILASTGHTISFARNLKASQEVNLPLREDTVLSLSPNMLRGKFNNSLVIGKWRRRDGLVYIGEKWVTVIDKLGKEFTVAELLSYDFSAADIYELLNEDMLVRVTVGKSSPVKDSTTRNVFLHYGNAFTHLKWYGYHDMD